MGRVLAAAERIGHARMRLRGLRGRYVEAGGARVHVYEGRGRGKLPTTVLLHGLGATSPSYGGLVSRLLPHVTRVVAPDLPGHGRSPHPGGGARVSPELVIEAMVGALDAVLDEPAIVCGNSLGGAVALAFAIRRPERVRGLALVSPAGARLEGEAWQRLVDTFDVSDRLRARRFLERVYHRPPWFMPLAARELPAVLGRRAVRDLLETMTPQHGPAAHDLAALAMPVLMLWGRSERLLPGEALTYFREHLPAHAVIEEPHAFGHAPQLEDPARVAARLVAFARDVTAGTAARR